MFPIVFENEIKISSFINKIKAERGLNIVLLSRTFSKLEEQSEFIKNKYSVDTKIIAANFTGKYEYMRYSYVSRLKNYLNIKSP